MSDQHLPTEGQMLLYEEITEFIERKITMNGGLDKASKEFMLTMGTVLLAHAVTAIRHVEGDKGTVDFLLLRVAEIVQEELTEKPDKRLH